MMKLSPAELAEIRANGFGRDDVVRLCEHIAAVEREHEQALSHWVDKCSQLGAERDRLKAAMEGIAEDEAEVHVDASLLHHQDCATCERMIEVARKALGK